MQINNLEEMNEKINQAMLSKQGEVLSGLFLLIKERLHANKDWKKCDCSVCKMMKDYVLHKIKLHKVVRRAKIFSFITQTQYEGEDVKEYLYDGFISYSTLTTNPLQTQSVLESKIVEIKSKIKEAIKKDGS